MPNIAIEFVSQTHDTQAHILVPVSKVDTLSGFVKTIDDQTNGAVKKVIGSEQFKAKSGSVLNISGLSHDSLEKISLIGTLAKKDDEPKVGTEGHFLTIGGHIMKAIGKKREAVSVVLDGDEFKAQDTANVAMGLCLRAYDFDRYKSKKPDDGEDDAAKAPKTIAVKIHVSDADASQAAWQALMPVFEGVVLARDLVNEPANILGPVEFAAKAKALEKQGCKVDILDEEDMQKLGMKALLGVSQGSDPSRGARLAVINWQGGKEGEAPIAFVGKGVVFDTGGISIKPASGMEDMKGDMGGAAAVLGLMHTLSGRKAKANVVGVLGLVENMPDGKAQRPGDIVTAMNGKTIEIINTDAEGRLVLADALHYTNERFKPQVMIDLATLTGAVIVALGHDHAGLYANDDPLAEALLAAGDKTGDKLWRMPLGKSYDKLIESKFADIKNSGGRWAGSITAAQFLKHFIGDTKWAHLDIAGTAFTSPETPINKGWASGFGVRGLDQYVRDQFET